MGVIGHRGSRATHPENTLAAFRQAIRCGADAAELDVVVTRDGKLAVTHDPVDVAFRELPPSVPELSEVLGLAAGNGLVFDIEMKECGELTPSRAEYAELVVSRVDAAGLRGRVMVRSFRHDFLRAVRKIRPGLPLAALVANEPRDWVDVCREAEAGCISPRFESVSAEAVARAHGLGIAVIPWTVNEPREWSEQIAAGVDAMVTDDPAALVQFCLRARYS